ncbi:MAG: tRNA-dihydrouridine synthase [Erysipelotrichaceae bacterium]|nr:tRNA-dihydrouridine synthase [Erysipelotrichaceae bacterium]
MVKIGNIELRNQIVAAPLAGISNPVYREIMHDYGAGLVVSEMISDKALHFHNAKTQDMCRVSENEHPVALQLFGSDPVTMAEASDYLTKNTNCDIIDINIKSTEKNYLNMELFNQCHEKETAMITVIWI